MNLPINRRDFLSFLGYSAAATAFRPSLAFSGFIFDQGKIPFTALTPGISDQVRLADGFTFHRILTEGDVLTVEGLQFGSDADFNAFFPTSKTGQEGILWTNHEDFTPLFNNPNAEEFYGTGTKSLEQVQKEQAIVGGSLVRIYRKADGQWTYTKNDPLNRRISAQTTIPFVSSEPILGARSAVGTMANCAGGRTPWGNVLTCEENVHLFYGEAIYAPDGTRTLRPSYHGWEKHFPYPPEHYGWVVEINPLTGAAKKLTGLGRFCHEGATVKQTSDGRCVVYMGDDTPNQCIYKFISDRPGSLDSGKLYVAKISEGKWLPLNREESPVLRDYFKSNLDILIRTREAAALVGGTPMNRPEDIEIDPRTGAVLVCLTNNKLAGDYFGSILKIEELNNDPMNLEFRASVFIPGGANTGFACPDNLVFDRLGNLWVTTDVSGTQIGVGEYKPFGNNSLFYIPMSGPDAGRAFRVASAPMDAEMTGPTFSADGRTLFVSIQHPGETSRKLNNLNSHWPEGGNSIPKSAVIGLGGPMMDKILGF